MGVKDLLARGEEKPCAYMCDRCGAIWDNDVDCAWCCGPVSCQRCSTVVERPSVSDYGGICWSCRKADMNMDEGERIQALFEKAEKRTWSERTPVVWFPDASVGPRGCWQADDPPPGEHVFAWASEVVRPGIDAEHVIESVFDEFDDDERPTVSERAEAELQELLDDWIERHASGVVSYEPNYRVAFLLPTGVN